jgi:hypothetical protein
MTYVSERRGPGAAFSRPGQHDHVSALGAPVAGDPIANPKPALGPRGEAAVVWVQENGAGATPVYVATRDATGTWTKPRDLADSFSAPSGVARGVRAAFAATGELFVVWAQQSSAGSLVVAARRSAQGRWLDTGRDPARLSSARVAYDPVLAVGHDGGVIAAWVEQEGPRDERVAVRRTGVDRPRWESIEWLSRAGGGRVAGLQAAMGPGDRTLVGWVSGMGDARVVFARVD